MPKKLKQLLKEVIGNQVQLASSHQLEGLFRINKERSCQGSTRCSGVSYWPPWKLALPVAAPSLDGVSLIILLPCGPTSLQELQYPLHDSSLWPGHCVVSPSGRDITKYFSDKPSQAAHCPLLACIMSLVAGRGTEAQPLLQVPAQGLPVSSHGLHYPTLLLFPEPSQLPHSLGVPAFQLPPLRK